ncbi:hypothetical protein [Chondromyces crocatus]|uniref:Uncharacterized protein n=1 Tax=Chondromyces crocatus TaxID=52 RepID=A0A0K1EEP5_CHOCO|nr:hypothetical protein [Chondromyces crocatus]AKT39324.1 uncharacterized protein CMC5_034710 [Chondromyces crocatus]
MQKKKPRRAPRAPFIVTVAVASAAVIAGLPGCGASVADEREPEADGCPEQPPSVGTSCNEIGKRCDYPAAHSCAEHVEAICGAGGTWGQTVEFGPCNPPPVACPASVPQQGSACELAPNEGCSYPGESECGWLETYASCESGSWMVTHPSCNPPPPDLCYGMSASECEVASPLCRWLQPGCDWDPDVTAPLLGEAGCFPLQGCDDEAWCPGGMTCVERSIDPCHGDVCDACALSEMLCVAL